VPNTRQALGETAAATGIERLLGRFLAICVHPYAAWRLGSTPVRAWALAAYFATGYAIVLAALVWLRGAGPSF